MISIPFLITALIVCIIPGTGVIYTLAIALGQGRSPAIAAAFGCTLGVVPHLLAATLGLAAVLHTSALLYQCVKYAGVAYLAYLAWQALKSDGLLAMRGDAPTQPAIAIIRRGALINILNPKLSIFFLALMPPFLSGNASKVTGEMILLGSVFMAITFATFVFYGVFAALARDKVLQNAAIMRWLNRSFAAVFALLGAKLAFER
ncbi:Threonine/homoserine/homoserine lactone efflux protein [Yoonia tamlensis]|uniref:Threonine/homoserine/homoserine lactone efflux protein n=1 Tax=Yoonia tamlensis TaxID=390270 RepID=A0A1I6HQR1_9RHOB|nr:LysE family translocator [Yoonia tamlensis]SFR56707.1 Threonine/homoserine/homoserine lactone efflux protein [Yoonia tamlensis]